MQVCQRLARAGGGLGQSDTYVEQHLSEQLRGAPDDDGRGTELGCNGFGVFVERKSRDVVVPLRVDDLRGKRDELPECLGHLAALADIVETEDVVANGVEPPDSAECVARQDTRLGDEQGARRG